MKPEEVMALLRDKSSIWNQAREVFSSACAQIEQAQMQRTKPTPVQWREMEFEAVRRIAAVLGVELTK